MKSENLRRASDNCENVRTKPSGSVAVTSTVFQSVSMGPSTFAPLARARSLHVAGVCQVDYESVLYGGNFGLFSLSDARCALLGPSLQRTRWLCTSTYLYF